MIFYTERYQTVIMMSENVLETNSPSMDIQIASNFERLIYDLNDQNDLKTADVMKKIKEKKI